MHDLVETSERAGDIEQSPPYRTALLDLRAFMFEHVYLGPPARAAERARRRRWSRRSSPTTWPAATPQSATDWVAGMTDGYALRAYAELAAAERAPA